MKKDLELIDILKQLYIVSGFRMSLYDTQMNLLAAYPRELTYFCSLIQQDPKALSLCREYDSLAAKKVFETGEVYLYQCHCGLYEAVAPLYHFGVLSGYLMMGQTIDTQETSRDFVLKSASPYVTDHELLVETVHSIPSRSKEQILSCISIMEICAAYLSLNNYLKSEDKELPGRIRAYLRTHFTSDVKIEDLCEEFYLSRSSLTSCFRRAYHTSIMEYVNRLRMEKALELLTTTDLSVHDISLQCGFQDQNYFTKVFRKYYGRTPSQMKLNRCLPLTK